MTMGWFLAAALLLSAALPDQAEEKPTWTQEEIAARIEKVFSPKESKKVKVLRGKHYILFTTSSAGSKFLEVLEDKVYKGFKEYFPFEESGDAPLMPIYLFPTRDDYWDFCVRYFGMTKEEARLSGGVASLDFYATYYRSPRDPTIFHEAAHQIMKNVLGLTGGGSWYQEGVAVYYEDKISKFNRFSETRAAIKVGETVPFRDFFSRGSLLYSSGKDKKGYGGSFGRYGQAAALMLFLKEGPLKDKFGAFFFRMGKEKKPTLEDIEKTVKEVYGLSIEELEEAWKQYFTR